MAPRSMREPEKADDFEQFARRSGCHQRLVAKQLRTPSLADRCAGRKYLRGGKNKQLPTGRVGLMSDFFFVNNERHVDRLNVREQLVVSSCSVPALAMVVAVVFFEKEYKM